MQGLSLDSSLLPSLATAKVPVATLTDPTDYGFDSHNVWDVPGALLVDAMASLGGLSDAAEPALTRAGQTAAQAEQAPPPARPLHRRRRPGPLQHQGRSTRTASSRGGSPDWPRCSTPASRSGPWPCRRRAATTPIPTRAARSQAGAQEVAAALAAFQADLEQRHLGQRVVTLLWSEFGRRAAQNDTNGTDHGAAGAAFLHGRRASGTRWSASSPASSRGLDRDGNLKETVDFRAVYASLAEQWFHVDAERILPDAKKMPRFSLVA